MNELVNNVKVARCIDPGQYLTGSNPTSVVVDRQFFEEVTLVLNTNTVTDAQALNIQESDASGSGYTDVVADDIVPQGTTTQAATLAAFEAMAAGDDNVVKKIGYKGSKRYLKVASTGAGGTGAMYGIVALLSGGRHKPHA